MTQEEKQLVFKDLCARLPYGVKIQRNSHYDPTKKVIEKLDAKEYVSDITYKNIERFEYKPYLRPMSSMTEEEKEEFESVLGHYDENNNPYESFNFGDDIDWLNAHHFDYRGLIPMGLALEAKEEMYKNK